jgi:hypothetical protein
MLGFERLGLIAADFGLWPVAEHWALVGLPL